MSGIPYVPQSLPLSATNSSQMLVANDCNNCGPGGVDELDPLMEEGVDSEVGCALSAADIYVVIVATRCK